MTTSASIHGWTRSSANIKERGVIVPIVAHYEDQGRGVVVDGQRRTLAAVQAGRDIIPAYVSAAP